MRRNSMTLRRRFATLAFALLAIPAATAHAAADEKSEIAAAYYEAFYLEAGIRDFEAAIAAYDELAKRATGDANFRAAALLGKGRCLRARARHDEARVAFEAVLALDPANAEAKSALEAKHDALDPELASQIRRRILDLEGPDRERAVGDLAGYGLAAIPILEENLRSRNIAIVRGCAQALFGRSSAHRERGLAAITRALRDPQVAFHAVIASEVHNPEGVSSEAALDYIEVALGSEDPAVRLGAIRMASSFQGRLANPGPEDPARIRLDVIYVAAFGDSDRDVAAIAAATAKRERPTVDAALLELARSAAGDLVIQALQCALSPPPLSEEWLTLVIARLADVDWGIRNAAFSSFSNHWTRGEFGSERFVDAFRACIDDGHRRSLVLSLEARKPAHVETWEALRALALADASAEVRQSCYELIRRGRNDSHAFAPPERPQMPRLLEDAVSDDPKLALQALEVLTLAPEPGDVEVIARVFERHPRELDSYVVDILAQYDSEAALAQLEEFVETSRDLVASRAARHLATKRGADYAPRLAAIMGARSDDPLVLLRHEMQNDLLLVRDPEFLRRFALALPRERWTASMLDRIGAAVATPLSELVVEGLRNASPDVRAAACRLVVTWNVETVDESLLALLDDPMPIAARAAQEALAALRTTRELRVKTALDLEFDRGAAITQARAMLADTDALKRRGGALALGALCDVASVPRLVALLDDPDAGVREAALAALAKIE
jgi:HEAT repeat protein